MNPTAIPTVLGAFEEGLPQGVQNSVQYIPKGTWSADGQTYSADTTGSFIPLFKYPGSADLFINGARDAQHKGADSNMVGNPQTITYQDATGNWHGYSPPPDFQHVIDIATLTPTFTPTPPGPPTPTPTPVATVQTPGPYTDYSGSPVLAWADGPAGSYEMDNVGDIFWAGPNCVWR
jgi:hypothetical protein